MGPASERTERGRILLFPLPGVLKVLALVKLCCEYNHAVLSVRPSPHPRPQGRNKEAEVMFRRCVHVGERAMAQDSVQLAIWRSNLARLLGTSCEGAK